MRDIVRIVLSIAVVAAAIQAARAKSLINAAIALALGSSALALLFFSLQAPFAGSVQFSVGAGVVSTLFLVAISLAESLKGRTRDGR